MEGETISRIKRICNCYVGMEPDFPYLPTADTYYYAYSERLIYLNEKLKFCLKASFSLILILLDSNF